jgi:glycosyltransferase involved in cell wall biosynthesis
MQKNDAEILYITYDGLTDPLGQSQVLPYITGLCKKGFRYTIISCEKSKNYKENHSIVREIIDAHNIDWVIVPYHKKPPVFSTIVDIFNIWRKTHQLIKKKNISLIHCRSYIPSLIGLYFKKKHSIPFIFDMRGFWADERVEGNLWNLGNPLYKTIFRFFKKKEADFFVHADYTISLTHKGEKVIRSWNLKPNDQFKIKIIPCCVDENLFNSNTLAAEKANALKQKLGIHPDDYILSYLGSVGTWYMLQEMLDFFLCFKQQEPKAKFLFVTPDPKEEILEKVSKTGIKPEDIIITKAKKAEIPLLLSLSAFSLFFIKQSFSKTASSPTKQGEIMSMGIPVVCNAGVGDTDQIVEKYQSGYLVQKFNEQDYQEVTAAMIRKKKTFDPVKIREGAIEYFSLQKGVEKYFEVYQEILTNSNSAS